MTLMILMMGAYVRTNGRLSLLSQTFGLIVNHGKMSVRVARAAQAPFFFRMCSLLPFETIAFLPTSILTPIICKSSVLYFVRLWNRALAVPARRLPFPSNNISHAKADYDRPRLSSFAILALQHFITVCLILVTLTAHELAATGKSCRKGWLYANMPQQNSG